MGLDDTIEVTTLADLLARAAQRRPEADAIVFPDAGRSYGELWAGVERAGRGLAGLGVGPGDHVGILMPNSVEFLEVLFGAAALGAVAVPVNSRYVAAELAHVVENADLAALVTSDAVAEHVDHVGRVREALPELSADGDGTGLELGAAPRLRSAVVLGSRSHAGFVDRERFEASADAVDARAVERLRHRVRVRDVGLMLYTSGTTAQPKGCVITHEALVRNGIALSRERFHLRPDDRMWDPLPMFHMAALLPLVGVVDAGAAYLSMIRVDAGESLAFMERERATVAFAGFAMLSTALITHPAFPATDLSALRLINTNGTPEVLRNVQSALPQAVQINPYGCTEAGGVVSFSEVTDTPEQRATWSGRPFRGLEVRVVDPETNTPLPPGERGELVVRGYALFEGYYKDPGKTSAQVDAEGWFHTGDVGSLDPEGRIRYLGRTKDMLKVGGENVAAAEIEDLLSSHPAVAVCQVVGVPDERLDEVPAAFVELAPGRAATAEELIAYCRGRFASFKVPRHVRIVSEWPMSATKIQKFRLREQLVAELSTADKVVR